MENSRKKVKLARKESSSSSDSPEDDSFERQPVMQGGMSAEEQEKLNS